MYIVYAKASDYATSYTHVSSYVVWRVPPSPPRRGENMAYGHLATLITILIWYACYYFESRKCNNI